MALDPNFSNVVLLCHFDGFDGTSTFIDSSPVGRALSAGGLLLTGSQFKFGTASLDHVGINGTVSSADSDDFDFAAGQFTVETWIRSTGTITGLHSFLAQWNNVVHSWKLGINGSTLQFQYSTTGSDTLTVGGTYTPTTGNWVHIAADRDASNVLRVYADGVVIASATVSATFFNSNSTFYISNDGSNAQGFIGQIDEARITKGVARYAGAFTPPTEAFPDSDHFSTLQTRGLIRETIGASDGILNVRGLVRETIGAGAPGLRQLIVQGIAREAIVVPSGGSGSTAGKQYSVSVVTS